MCAGGEKGKQEIGVKACAKRFVYNHCLVDCYTWGTGFIEDYSSVRTGLIRNRVHFLAVRGVNSQKCIEKILNKKINPTLGDGGILAPLLIEENIGKEYEIGIIPHFRERQTEKLTFLKEKYPNAKVINLCDDPLEVIREIARCNLILSSSLHGLIVADSFRIPNKRIYLTDAPIGSGFKFDDYYSAYGLKNPGKRIDSADCVPSLNEIMDEYSVTDMMVETMKKDMYSVMKTYLDIRR